MAGIALSEIRKSFGKTEVLKGVSLDIGDGEFVSLLGPSGCGKSTLLRIVAGLETQDSGSVEIADRCVDAIRPSERNLAMVFQSYALYPHLSVLENMMVPLRMRDLSALERLPVVGHLLPGRHGKVRVMRDKAHAAAEMLRIAPLLDRKPGQLSGGQRQRVALGRAMVREPLAFLMDEPLSNLDAALRVHMRAEIADLQRQLGATFIYVTHDQVEAMTMSNRIAVMLDGDIVQVGSPSEVYDDPRDIRVAEFIGSPKINVLSIPVGESGRPVLQGRALKEALPVESGTSIRLGIRPEHLAIVSVEHGQIAGRLRHKENLGAEVLLHVDVAGVDRSVVVRVEPSLARAMNGGDQVGLGFAAPDLRFFDDAGKRITVRPTQMRNFAYG